MVLTGTKQRLPWAANPDSIRRPLASKLPDAAVWTVSGISQKAPLHRFIGSDSDMQIPARRCTYRGVAERLCRERINDALDGGDRTRLASRASSKPVGL
jgi:hypothetical protein